jgi:ribose 5-phosphate isomerase B
MAARGQPLRVRRVAVGSDHGGFALKAKLIRWLRAKGLEVADLGTHSSQPCDYPRIGYKVAAAVAQGTFERGVLLCKSGVGIAIAANKVPGIRAGVCGDLFDAERSRAHNNANVLVLGAEKLTEAAAKRIVETWFATPFEAGGRHERRVRQIAAIERRLFRSQKSEVRGQKSSSL